MIKLEFSGRPNHQPGECVICGAKTLYYAPDKTRRFAVNDWLCHSSECRKIFHENPEHMVVAEIRGKLCCAKTPEALIEFRDKYDSSGVMGIINSGRWPFLPKLMNFDFETETETAVFDGLKIFFMSSVTH